MSRRWADLPADERPSARDVAAALLAAADLFGERDVLGRVTSRDDLKNLSLHCRMLAGQLLRMVYDRLSLAAIARYTGVHINFLDDVAFCKPQHFPVARKREEALTLWLRYST
jgi:hypothetical protein